MTQTQIAPTDREKLAELLIAAKNGGAAFVLGAIGKGVDPLAQWPGAQAHSPSGLAENISMEGIVEGDTFLLVADRHGHRQLAEALLPISDLTARNAFGVTILMSAALRGDADLVSSLLPLLDDKTVAARTQSGLTALGFACERGHTQVLRVLLADGRLNGSSIEQSDTALKFAFQAHSWGCVAVLANTDSDRQWVASMLEEKADRGVLRSLVEAVEALGELAPMPIARLVASNPANRGLLPGTLARIEACALADVVAASQSIRSQAQPDDPGSQSAAAAASGRRIQRI